jgi:hypothetical protein
MVQAENDADIADNSAAGNDSDMSEGCFLEDLQCIYPESMVIILVSCKQLRCDHLPEMNYESI